MTTDFSKQMMNSSRQSEMNDTADFEFTPLQKSILLELKKKKEEATYEMFLGK